MQPIVGPRHAGKLSGSTHIRSGLRSTYCRASAARPCWRGHAWAAAGHHRARAFGDGRVFLTASSGTRRLATSAIYPQEMHRFW